MNKNLLLIYIGLLVAAYFAGKHSSPAKVEVKKEIVYKEVEKKTTTIDQDQDKRITEIVKPDGTKIKRTHIFVRKKSQIDSSAVVNSQTHEQKIVAANRGVNLSLLAGAPLQGLTYSLVYGVSANKPFFGPISLGLWAFSDLRVGVSVGIDL